MLREARAFDKHKNDLPKKKGWDKVSFLTGCGSAWLERSVRDAEAARSNRAIPTRKNRGPRVSVAPFPFAAPTNCRHDARMRRLMTSAKVNQNEVGMARKGIRSSRFSGVHYRGAADPRRGHNGRPDRQYDFLLPSRGQTETGDCGLDFRRVQRTESRRHETRAA